MMHGLVVTGFPRAGTTLLYCMLQFCVRGGYRFDEREHWRARAGCIVKSPRAVFADPDPGRCIVLLRDPRALLTSRHPGWPGDYFVSAHHCANDAGRGLCEWWRAIRRLLRGPRLPLVLRYEELISQPDQAQASIVNAFGLSCAAEFSEFVHGQYGPYWETALGGVRPLRARAIYDAERVHAQFRQFPELCDVAAEMGYA